MRRNGLETVAYLSVFEVVEIAASCVETQNKRHLWRVPCAALLGKERESVVLPHFPRRVSEVLKNQARDPGGRAFLRAIHLTHRCYVGKHRHSHAKEHFEVDGFTHSADRPIIASVNLPQSLGGAVFEEKKVTSMSGNELDEFVFFIPAL